MGREVDALFQDIEARHPRSLQGVREARQVDPERFDQTAGMYLRWAMAAKGENWLPIMVDAFVRFSTDVTLAQARYEADGSYQNKSFSECQVETYGNKDVMDDYLWGVYLTNFLWCHHMEISLFFQDRFIDKLASDARIVEIAPGHGGWGLLALERLKDATLRGYDISRSSIDIAQALAKGAGLDSRANYQQRDAMELGEVTAPVDAVICSFLIEHLEEPGRLLRIISDLVKDGGLVFITGALTAAQIDHIYEFRRESELVVLCEENDLRVTESFSGNPRRTLPKAKFLPRSMAIIARYSKNI